jgi:hypothetical protein
LLPITALNGPATHLLLLLLLLLLLVGSFHA